MRLLRFCNVPLLSTNCPPTITPLSLTAAGEKLLPRSVIVPLLHKNPSSAPVLVSEVPTTWPRLLIAVPLLATPPKVGSTVGGVVGPHHRQPQGTIKAVAEDLAVVVNRDGCRDVRPDYRVYVQAFDIGIGLRQLGDGAVAADHAGVGLQEHAVAALAGDLAGVVDPVRLGWRPSASHGKAAGPGYFLLRGQGNLQEAERLQFTRTAQGACVDRAEATGSDHVGELRLGVAVVTGDQDGGGYLAGGAGG